MGVLIGLLQMMKMETWGGHKVAPGPTGRGRGIRELQSLRYFLNGSRLPTALATLEASPARE